MIWIQVILVIGLLAALGRLFVSPSSNQTKALTKLLGVLFTFLALIVIIFPNTSNDIAHALGVSRGADLLLYLLTLAFIFVTIKSYVKAQNDQKTVVQLARRMAIVEANRRYGKRP